MEVEFNSRLLQYLGQNIEAGAFSSPNPGQVWGSCGKRNKGRYGLATACGAALTSPDGPGEAIGPQAGDYRHD